MQRRCTAGMGGAYPESAEGGLFIYAVFVLLGKALRFQRRETEGANSALTIALDAFALRGAGRLFAMGAFADGARSPLSAEAYAQALAAHFSDDQDLLHSILSMYCQISMHSGDLDEREQQTIWAIGRRFALPETAIAHCLGEIRHQRGYTATDPQAASNRQRRHNLPAPVREAFRDLGTDPNLSIESLRSVYLDLAKQYHPDKLAHEAVNDGYKVFARRRLDEISNAVDCIREFFRTKQS
ncbi:MAG: J domain-containing protein [Planctomycetota bacterium]